MSILNTLNKNSTQTDKINNNPIHVLGKIQSFEADSLSDYSEFDSDSVTLDYFKER